MTTLRLLATIALAVALGTTGVAGVSAPSDAMANLNAALNRVRTNLEFAAQVQLGTQMQHGKGETQVSANSQADTRVTTNSQKKGSTVPQPASSTKANAMSSTNAKVNVTTKAASTVNATLNQKADSSLKVATAIADKFGVAVSEVVTLHDSGWGFGEIEKLYAMAQESGQPVATIKSMRASGKGWGEIAQALDVSVSGPSINLGAIVSGQGTLGFGHK